MTIAYNYRNVPPLSRLASHLHARIAYSLLLTSRWSSSLTHENMVVDFFIGEFFPLRTPPTSTPTYLVRNLVILLPTSVCVSWQRSTITLFRIPNTPSISSSLLFSITVAVCYYRKARNKNTTDGGRIILCRNLSLQISPSLSLYRFAEKEKVSTHMPLATYKSYPMFTHPLMLLALARRTILTRINITTL